MEHSKNEDTEIVTMEKFGNILVWFGPIVDAPQQVVILDNIYSILSKEFVLLFQFFLFLIDKIIINNKNIMNIIIIIINKFY